MAWRGPRQLQQGPAASPPGATPHMVTRLRLRDTLGAGLAHALIRIASAPTPNVNVARHGVAAWFSAP